MLTEDSEATDFGFGGWGMLGIPVSWSCSFRECLSSHGRFSMFCNPYFLLQSNISLFVLQSSILD